MTSRRVRAFTLVELMIVLTIVSIVLAGVFDVLRLSLRGLARGDAEASLAEELSLVVDRIRADLRAACVDATAGGQIAVSSGGTEVRFLRAATGDADGPPGKLQVSYRFESSGERTRLVRTAAGAGSAAAEERVVSEDLAAVRFTIYSRRLQSPLLSYSTRLHPDFSPLFLRIELAARTRAFSRELVTSVGLQPYTRRQLDPYWNPVRFP